jgi:hypothetical protein
MQNFPTAWVVYYMSDRSIYINFRGKRAREQRGAARKGIEQFPTTSGAFKQTKGDNFSFN